MPIPSSRGQKSLPAGGSKPKTPADTGAALVRTRQSNDKQRAASGPAGGVRTPNTYRSGKDSEEEKKKEKDNKEKKDRFAGLRRRAGDAIGRAGSEVEAGMSKEGKGLEGSKEIVRGERK